MIQFAHPAYFWLLVLLPLIALWRGRRGRVAAIEYSSAEAARQIARETRSRPGRWLPMLARLGVLALAIVALAQPRIGRGRADVQASGIDLMLALDMSGSMKSLDFKVDGKPLDRFDIVKSVVGKFIDQRPDDSIGLVGFAGAPYLVSPLTLDHDWLEQNLDRLEIGQVEDGTAIGSAIAAGVNRQRAQPSKSKVIVLLTDGQNNAGKVSPLMAAEAAKALGVKIYTIGVGIRGDAPMPIKDEFGQTQIVMAKVDVDEDMLAKIANETGGKFYRATDTEALQKVYTEIDQLEKTTHHVRKYETYREMFAFALIPGLLLFGAELGLSQTRFRRLP